MKWYKSFSINRTRLDLVATDDSKSIFRVIYIDIEWNEPVVRRFMNFDEASAVFYFILECCIGCIPEDCSFDYNLDNYPNEIVL